MGKKIPGHFFLLNIEKQNIITLDPTICKKDNTTQPRWVLSQECEIFPNAQKSINAIYHSNRIKKKMMINSIDSEEKHLLKLNP